MLVLQKINRLKPALLGGSIKCCMRAQRGIKLLPSNDRIKIVPFTPLGKGKFAMPRLGRSRN